MKLFILSASLVFLFQIAQATPTPTLDETGIQARQIAKRATITDIATTGYATQNGGYVLNFFSVPYPFLRIRF